MAEKKFNSQWKVKVKQLLSLLESAERDEDKIGEVLDDLNAFVYPVELCSEVTITYTYSMQVSIVAYFRMWRRL